MMKKSFTLVAALLLTGVGCGAAFADWTAEFHPPADGQSTMRIDLPDDIDFMVLTTLGVELDGIDVTALLSLDGTDFIFTPVEPLSGGEHTIRLVLLNNDGGNTEQYSWNFATAVASGDDAVYADSSGDQSNDTSYLRSDNLAELSYRALQHLDEDNAPNRAIASGAGDVGTGITSGNWNINSRANYLLQSDVDYSQTGHVLDIGEYDIDASYSGEDLSGGVKLGHHGTGLSSYLVNNFYRRGLSAKLGTSDSRMDAQVFSFNPESLMGVDNITGLNDSDERLSGVSASVKPFSSDFYAMKLTGIYYDGKGGDGGVGISGTSSASEGSGWSAVLEKDFEALGAKFALEYTSTEFDQDGYAGSSPTDDGDAIAANFSSRLFDDSPVWLDHTANMNWGIGYNRVSTYFESLANQGAASDRDAINVFGNLYWGAFSTNLQALYETNNVDDLESMPTNRLASLGLGLNYAFDQQTDGMSWLGTPYINFQAFGADMAREDTPANYSGYNTNNFSDSFTLGGGSNYDVWYWSASHSYSEFEDYTNNASDTVNNLTSLDSGWTVSDRLDLTGGLQFGSYKDESNNNNSYDTNIRFGINADVIPEKLDFNFDYNLNLASGTGDRPDRHNISSELEWTFIQPLTNSPGFALAAQGSMEDRFGNASDTDNEKFYQVFAVLRVKAPFSTD